MRSAGYVEVTIGGEARTLVCDMNCADALFYEFGEYWQIWLLERFIGKPVKVDGQKALHFEPLPPGDLVRVVHAMLAQDRRRSGRVETVDALRESITYGVMQYVHDAVVQAILGSFGAPGKESGHAGGAAGGAHGVVSAPMPGTHAR